MRALVTGAAGFVGRHLVAHLGECGDEVIGADRDGTGPDLLDAEGLAAFCKDIRPTVIFHLAGQADVGGSWSAPIETFRVNAEGTLNLLQAASAAGVDRVLVIGSADVYGVVSEDDLPLDEDTPLRPVSPYAASKVAAEFLALQAYLGGGLATIRVRPFNHLGPGQSDRFVAPALALRIARNERSRDELLSVGNLSPRRDFTDVRDVVSAYRLLVERGTPGEVYNVCSGHDVAIEDLAEMLVGMADHRMTLEPDPALQRPVDIPVLRGDNTRLRTATGWVPRIPLEQTLVDLLEDARGRVERELVAAREQDSPPQALA